MHDDEALFRVLYDSVVLLPFGEAGEQGMRDIIAVSQARNATLGITGVLYCDGAYFMQVLEGPRAAVEAVMASVRRDPRHTDLHVVSTGPVERRDFAAWSMAQVSESDMINAVSRHPHMPDVHPYRAAELVAAMRIVLAGK